MSPVPELLDNTHYLRDERGELMSAQLEDVTEQMSFEGMPVQRTTLTLTVTITDARIDGEPLDASLGDRVTLDHIEAYITDVNHGEKQKPTIEDGRTVKVVGVGPVTRRHIGAMLPGSGVISNLQRRESDEDRVRRLTR